MCRPERDAVRGYLLFIGGAAVAYAYGTVCGDCLRFRNIGFDPAFADLSPGIVLTYRALGEAIGEARFSLIDFGSGEAQYKTVAAHYACAATPDGCSVLLARLGFKERV